jgi:hypothetical protein
MPSGSGYALSGDKCMQYPSNISFAADTWIFSPNLVLTPGITYRLSYWYREATAGKTEKMKVTIGSNATIASQTTILHDHPAITNTTYAQGIDNFTVPATEIIILHFNVIPTQLLTAGYLLTVSYLNR